MFFSLTPNLHKRTLDKTLWVMTCEPTCTLRRKPIRISSSRTSMNSCRFNRPGRRHLR